MKIFFDMEFTGLTQNAQPISIGLVSESGRTFYAEFNQFATDGAPEWLKENVVPYLRFTHHYEVTPRLDCEHHAMKGTSYAIAADLRQWLEQFGNVEMWSDCLAYDWVLFCELFGGAMSLPTNVYYIPFDLCTLLALADVDPDINREEYAQVEGGEKHNALWDAKVIRACWAKASVRFDT